MKVNNNIEKAIKYFKTRIDDNTIIVCIGTPKCKMDAIGPSVGTRLVNSNYKLKVYGTLEDPIHALNLNDKMKVIKENHPDSNIIALDACVTNDEENVGTIIYNKKPIRPGKGVGKRLQKVGDYSLKAIVSTREYFKPYNFTLTEKDVKGVNDLIDKVYNILMSI